MTFTKTVALPYIVLLDANMPPGHAEKSRNEWVPNVNRAVELGDSVFNDVGIRVGSVFNFLAVTNVPDHYGEAAAPLPEPVFYSVRPAEARRAVQHSEVFADIERGLLQCHRVPSEFLSEA